VTNGKPKTHYYPILAEAIFDVKDELVRESFLMNKAHYSTSVMGRIATSVRAWLLLYIPHDNSLGWDGCTAG
jgi:hypothetical protein